jgi:transposase-like protein
MNLKDIKLAISKLPVEQRLLLVNEIKESYSIFHKYVDITCCPHCNSENIIKNGIRNGSSKYLCKNVECKKNFTFRTGTILSGIQNLNKWNLFVEDFMSLNMTPLEELKTKIGVNSFFKTNHIEHGALKGVSTKYLSNYAKWYEFIHSVKVMVEHKEKLAFNIVDNICTTVVTDNHKIGLEGYRSSELSFVNFLTVNGRTNYGSCVDRYNKVA